MKFNSISALLLAALVSVSTGCSDDLGNYSYADINEVTVNGSDSSEFPELISGQTYDLVAHVDYLRFSPKLQSTLGVSEDNYEFEWRVMPTGGSNDNISEESKVVCTTRVIDQIVGLAAGKYSCFFNVKDKTTGVTWSTPFYLTVRSITSEGWLVLCDVDNWPRIDVVFNKSATEDIIARDILSGQSFDPGKPRSIMYTYHNSHGAATILVTDKDTYLVDNNDMHVGEDNRMAWLFGVTPDNLVIKTTKKSQYAEKNAWILIDDKDDIYTLDISTSGSFFEYPINKIEGTVPFTPAPFIGVNVNNSSWKYQMNGGNTCVLYDQTHRQFLMLTGSSVYPKVMNFQANTYFENPTGRDMLWMEGTHSGIIKSVLRDPQTNDVYWYGIALRTKEIPGNPWWLPSTYVPYQTQEGYSKITGPGIERADKYAFADLNPYLFYLVDNKIYQLNLSEPNQPAKEVLSFPGETIVEMKFVPLIAWRAYTDWERAREYQLVVATNVDGKADNECGIVRHYEVPNLMGPLTLDKKIDGFGKILEVVYKEVKL